MTTSLLLNRRQFLKQSAAAALVASASPLFGAAIPARNYRTALIGCGWWGNNILGEAMASGECRVVGLCGVDQGFLQDTLARVGQLEAGCLRRAWFRFQTRVAKLKEAFGLLIPSVLSGAAQLWKELRLAKGSLGSILGFLAQTRNTSLLGDYRCLRLPA